jgi:hypothetical protein
VREVKVVQGHAAVAGVQVTDVGVDLLHGQRLATRHGQALHSKFTIHRVFFSDPVVSLERLKSQLHVLPSIMISEHNFFFHKKKIEI